MLTFMAVGLDLNIHLGDLIVTAAIAILGFMLKQIYTLIAGKIVEHTVLIENVDAHAEMINLHSGALNHLGHKFPLLERRKHARRSHSLGLDMEND